VRNQVVITFFRVRSYISGHKVTLTSISQYQITLLGSKNVYANDLSRVVN